MDDTKARAWFGATAALVLIGIAIQVPVAATNAAGFFHSKGARALNVFVFFTIQSNMIVGATCLLLALNPRRRSTVFSVFRLTGVVAITITGIVYHAALRGLFDLDTWALVADNILHTVVPVLAVLGWLMYGPRGLISSRIVRLSLIFPVLWLIFSLIRGEIVGFYPYPFVDVGKLGYGPVIVNCVWVAVLYFGVASGAAALDRWLARVKKA